MPNDPTALADFLGHIPLFARLGAERRSALAGKARVVHVAAGESAFRQGDVAQAVYLVRTGRLELWKDGAQVGSVAAGTSLGEVSLLAGEAHTVTAVARRDSELIVIDKADFAALSDDRAFSASLLDDLGRMLAATGTFARFRPRTKRSVLALVPIGLDVSVADMRDDIVARLRQWGPTAVWSTADFAEPPHELDFPELGRRLDELERAHDFVVLETDPSIKGTAWTRFCARQADRILGVAGTDPAPPPTYEGSRTALQGCELVFAAPAAPEIRRGWIDRLAPRAHYNLPAERADAVGALTRRVTGRSIGLVLSGGGARGLAHIGCIRGLLDAGIVIDRVGGTSMGAFVGALFAMGHTPEEIVELCRRELVDGRPFHDFSVPLVSLARGRRAIAMMERLFGDTHIEDLPIDFFCVTADLAAGEGVVHRRGDIIRTVGASMSIPGWAPPITFGERVLVDGGVVNNFPVGVMAATGEGPVIGVDAMANSAIIKAGKSPNIMETLGGAATLGSRKLAEASAEDAAVVIKPDVGSVGLVDFHHIDRLFAIGRQTALDAVAGVDLTRG